jgi:hypothetical protein
MLGSTLFFIFVTHCIHLIFTRTPLKRFVTSETDSLVTVSGTITTVTLAFIIVVMWQDFDNLQHSVNDEAKTINKMMDFAEVLPPADAALLNENLMAYTNSILNDEWEAMRHNKVSQKTSLALKQLQNTIVSLEARTDIPSNYREIMVANLSEIISMRDHRLESLHSLIPPFFSTMIVLLLLGLIIVMCLVRPTREGDTHILTLWLVSGSLGLSFSLLFILDYPFTGSFSINTDAFQEQIFEKDPSTTIPQ